MRQAYAVLRLLIAYLPQSPFVPEKATVMEAMGLTAPGLTEGEARRALEEMGVWERMARGAGTEPLHGIPSANRRLSHDAADT